MEKILVISWKKKLQNRSCTVSAIWVKARVSDFRICHFHPCWWSNVPFSQFSIFQGGIHHITMIVLKYPCLSIISVKSTMFSYFGWCFSQDFPTTFFTFPPDCGRRSALLSCEGLCRMNKGARGDSATARGWFAVHVMSYTTVYIQQQSTIYVCIHCIISCVYIYTHIHTKTLYLYYM
jgi:hypothetical protein